MVIYMDRIDKILKHDLFIENLKKNQAAEADRRFCRHDMAHFLDVARIGTIINLEENLGISKEVIYGAALLHDIGKHRQYGEGIPHEQASAQISANWPTKRDKAWSTLLAARAIENIAYVAGVNRSGSDDYGEYDSTMSKVVDYVGDDISVHREDGIVIAQLDKSRLNSFRSKFPFLNDADNFKFY